jgi:hypothetical protein
MNKERLMLLAAIIGAAALARVLPHPVNVTPVAAIALFAGATLPRGFLAFLIPLAAMFVADLIIGFHSTMLFVYAGMVITVALGMLLQNKQRPLNIAGASLVSSVVFFILTNFGVWMMQDIYPHDASGLLQSYVAALPFFTNSILGDLGFAALLFGVFSFAQQRFPQLRASAA